MNDPGPGAFDTHTHLNHPRLLPHLPEVLARARKVGVTQMLVIGYDLSSSEIAVKLAEENLGLWASVGVHPHDADSVDEAMMQHLRRLAQSPRVVAIGETGLDFYRELSPRWVQMDVFQRHLELAAELALPAIVHCRQAQGKVLEMLENFVGQEHASRPVIWHCFDGSKEEAKQALDLGSFLGFGGMLTYSGAEELRAVAAETPENQLLIETDCPYLAPEPLPRSKYNEPANLPIIISLLAEIGKTETEEVIAMTTRNAFKVLRLSPE